MQKFNGGDLMKRRILLFVCALTAFTALGAAACSKGGGTESGKSVYQLNGVKDIELTETDSTADFLAGVTGTKDGKAETVVVDSSSVIWGEKGIYTITYTCGTEKMTAKVYIYATDRTPVVIGEPVTITYSQAMTPGSLLSGITAMDALGQPITDVSVSAASGFNKTAFGLISYGASTITYEATDKDGNKGSGTRVVTVSEEGRPTLAAATIDLESPDLQFNYEGKTFLGLYNGNAEVAAENYMLNDNNCIFYGDYLAELGVGTHTLVASFAEGYCDYSITIEDKKDLKYDITGEFEANDYLVGSEVVFPRATRGQYSWQNMTISYLLDGKSCTDKKQTFDAAGDHTFKIVVRRGEEIPVETEYAFKIMTTDEYYGQNWVKEANLSWWESKNADNGDKATYVSDNGGAIRLVHSWQGQDDARGFICKGLIQKAIAAGMTEMTVKYSAPQDVGFYISTFNKALTPPWNAETFSTTCWAADGVKATTLYLDDAYLNIDTSANADLFFLIIGAGLKLDINGISFKNVDHTLAYAQSYKNANTISTSVTVAKGVSLRSLEFFLTGEAGSILGVQRGLGLKIVNNADNDQWIALVNSERFDITHVDMGINYPAGTSESVTAIGGWSPLKDGQFPDREGYYNADGSRTFTAKFIPDYRAGNTRIEFWFGEALFFTITPLTKTPIVTSGTVAVLVNGGWGAQTGVDGFTAQTETKNYYTATGINDVDFSIGVAQGDYDYLNGVVVKCNDRTVIPDVDDGNVQYGKAGTYQVIYFVGEEWSMTVNVTISTFSYDDTAFFAGLTTTNVTDPTLSAYTTVMMKDVTFPTVSGIADGNIVSYKLDGTDYDVVAKPTIQFTQPGKHVWTISVKLGAGDDAETVVKEYPFEVINATAPIYPANADSITMEFTVNNSASFDTMGFYLSSNSKSLSASSGRKYSAGLELSKDNKICFEGYNSKGYSVDTEFEFALGTGVEMGGTTGNASSNGQLIWAVDPTVPHGKYNQFYGGETATSRMYKVEFIKREDGGTMVKFFIGNATTKEYTLLFTVSSSAIQWPGTMRKNKPMSVFLVLNDSRLTSNGGIADDNVLSADENVKYIASNENISDFKISYTVPDETV